MISPTRRLLALQPWLVRAAIPSRMMGTYLLYRGGHPTYAGRSDHDLRARLIWHAQRRRAEYFEFDVHLDVRRAFEVECALFHALEGHTTNVIHPASRAGVDLSCFVCSYT